MTDVGRFSAVLGAVAGRRVTYAEVTGSSEGVGLIGRAAAAAAARANSK